MKKLEIMCRKSDGDLHQVIFKYDGAERDTIEEFLSKYNIREYISNDDGTYFFNINSGKDLSDFAKDAWFGRSSIDSGDVKLAMNSYCRLRGAVDQKKFPDEVEGAGLSNYNPNVKQGELRTISGVLQTDDYNSKEESVVKVTKPKKIESKEEKSIDKTVEEVKVKEEPKQIVDEQGEPKMEYKKPSKAGKFFKGVFYTGLVASIGAGGYFMNEGYKQMKSVEKEIVQMQEELGKISYLTKKQSKTDPLAGMNTIINDVINKNSRIGALETQLNEYNSKLNQTNSQMDEYQTEIVGEIGLLKDSLKTDINKIDIELELYNKQNIVMDDSLATAIKNVDTKIDSINNNLIGEIDTLKEKKATSLLYRFKNIF